MVIKIENITFNPDGFVDYTKERFCVEFKGKFKQTDIHDAWELIRPKRVECETKQKLKQKRKNKGATN